MGWRMIDAANENRQSLGTETVWSEKQRSDFAQSGANHALGTQLNAAGYALGLLGTGIVLGAWLP